MENNQIFTDDGKFYFCECGNKVSVNSPACPSCGDTKALVTARIRDANRKKEKQTVAEQVALQAVSVAGDTTAGVMRLVFGILIFVATLGYLLGYFIPTAIAIYRGVNSRVRLIWVNLLLGWTLLGWIVALIWAITGEQTEEIKLAKLQTQAELEGIYAERKKKLPWLPASYYQRFMLVVVLIPLLVLFLFILLPTSP